MSPESPPHPVARVRALLREAAGRVFPGAVLAVERGGRLRLVEAVGRTAAGPDAAPVGPDTVFDLASLTKPLATATVLATLFAEGRADPDGRLDRHVPEAAGTPWAGVSPATLMAHAAGLPAWRPYGPDLYRELGPGAAGSGAVRREVLRRILAEPPGAPPGATCVYSDLGYMLLDRVVEAAAGTGLAAAFAARVAGPLGLRRTFFAPVAGDGPGALPVPAAEVAATEACPLRGRVLRGEVHDENAWMLGGVAGHAGLFGTAGEAARIGTALRDAWAGRAGGPFAPAVIRAFWDAAPLPGATRVPGFDIPSPAGSSAGDRHPARLVGHLGFTGTSIWIDPDGEACVVLLTNRVHPTRANEAIKAFRPVLHDAVWEALRAGAA